MWLRGAIGAGGHESTVVVVGNRGAGKTTLVSRFLNPDKDMERAAQTIQVQFKYK